MEDCLLDEVGFTCLFVISYRATEDCGACGIYVMRKIGPQQATDKNREALPYLKFPSRPVMSV